MLCRARRRSRSRTCCASGYLAYLIYRLGPNREIGCPCSRRQSHPCSFELGGKSPTIILDDADLDLAATLAVDQYDNAGQVCLAGTRLLVQASIANEFAAKFAERAALIKQGDPRDEESQIGPNIHAEHVDRIDGFVKRARADGATIAFGGERNTKLGGLYYRPTLVTDAKAGSEILTAEVFGPVLTMQTFETDDEGLEMANGTDFGLAAVVVTGNRDRAEAFTKHLVAGTIWVNCFFVRDLQAPFGIPQIWRWPRRWQLVI